MRSFVLPICSEIDLRGMESIDAVIAAEQYLDSAVMAKMKTVTIIHGKGTGALRTATVPNTLRQNKCRQELSSGTLRRRRGRGDYGRTEIKS